MIQDRSRRLGPLRVWFEKVEGSQRFTPWAFNLGPTSVIPAGGIIRTLRGTHTVIGRLWSRTSGGPDTFRLGWEFDSKALDGDKIRTLCLSLGFREMWVEVSSCPWGASDEQEATEAGGILAPDMND